MSTEGAINDKILKRANPSTIQDKFLVGYQGWFTCPGDGEPIGPGHHGWLHWFNSPITAGGRPNTDIWPDTSTYSPSELFPAPGLKYKSGEQVFLFSSRHPKTVQRHFHWMAQHGVDGAFLQRFAGQCDVENGNMAIRRLRDEVGDRVQEAAEKEGRVFAIMYDVSGVPPDRIQRIIQQDWIHLIRVKRILDSPNYLREKGKPVVALWGFGFDNSGHSPTTVRAITSFIRSVTPGGAYVMAGTPAYWRSSINDADRNPEFLDVWLNEFDAISPWTVGRYGNEEEADNFAETNIKGDVELLKKRNEEGRWRKIDYIPVVLPGGSGFNLSEGKWGFNNIKRNGGRFLWQQIFNARRQGVRVIYGAMWDEYDEGTAFMPVVEKKRMLPVSERYRFMALDEDGFDLPSDWYMRICGFAAEGLRSERMIHESFPSKELQDYWSTRPRYEDADKKVEASVAGSSGEGGSGGNNGQSYQDWLAAQKEDKEEPPPPPYSLEADESANDVQHQPAETRPVQPTSPPLPVSSPTSASSPIPATAAQPPLIGLPSSTSPVHSPSQRPSAATLQPSISALSNDFGRLNVSSAPGLGPGQSVSPTPLHPAASLANPTQLPSQSQSPTQPHTGTLLSSTPVAGNPQSSGPGSQTQWPPSEWKANRPQHHQHPLRPSQEPLTQQQSSHSGNGLTRPHSFSASYQPTSSSSLGSHGSIGASSVKPSMTLPPQTSSNYPGSYPQPSTGNFNSPYPATSPYPPISGGLLNPSGSSSLPSTPSASSYTPGRPSNPSSSSYTPSGTLYPAQGPSYPSQPYSAVRPYASAVQNPNAPYGMPQSQAYPSHAAHGGPPQFPQAHGHISTSGPQPQPQPSYLPSTYPGQYGVPYNAPFTPAPTSPVGMSFPVQSNTPMPPGLPPRPMANLPYSQPGPPGPSFPTASSSSSTSALGIALSTVDKLAGKKAREQLESQVDNLTHTSNKLFSKFTW